MKKDIYKITNLINGKIYIGQSVDPEYRFRKHKEASQRPRTYESCLYNAMNKYGVDNFQLTIIESDVENYNEREIYWIKTLNSLRPNGYNIAEGGEWYPNLSGIYHHSATIRSQSVLDDIYELLAYSELTEQQIANKYGVSQEIISNINIGKSYRQEAYSFPLRKTNLTINEVRALINDLMNNLDLTYDELAIKYNISKVQVKAINYGKSWIQSDLTYPLRKYNCNFANSVDILQRIHNDLINTKISYIDLAEKYQCSRSTIIRINTGESYHNPDWSYPIRKTNSLEPQALQELHHLLMTTDISFKELGKQFGISDITIKRINRGEVKKYFDHTLKYPLR